MARDMYHYTESGLRNVYLKNGYTITKTEYGEAISIKDVAGLHRTIGSAIARKTHLTGAELRFLRKELGLSQRALASLIGASEQVVSLWERKGKMPRAADRLVRVLYLETAEGNVRIKKWLEDLARTDERGPERMELQTRAGQWRKAA